MPDLSRKFVVFAVFVMLGCMACAAQSMSGFFSSPKGFGLSLQTPSGDSFDSFTIHVDMYGLFSSRTDIPGVKVCYTRNRILKTYERDGRRVETYLGLGCAAGYVHDFEKGDSALRRHPGASIALAGVIGSRMVFKNVPVCLDFSFRGEAGVHIRTDEELGNSSLSLYVNGLIQTLSPQVSILYCF